MSICILRFCTPLGYRIVPTGRFLSPNLYRSKTNTFQYSTESKKSQGWTLWKGIFTRFIPIGICLIAVMEWRAYRKHKDTHSVKQWEVDVYCSLPLRTLSRCWGWFAERTLPTTVRPYVYGLYVNTFGVNICEAQNEDLKSYASLSDFFVRELKEGIRPVETSNCLVSPCDGTVLHFGTVNSGQIEQVKGVTYSLDEFLGDKIDANRNSVSDYKASLIEKSNTLYQCVIYLAPGDYHRFHSPTNWNPTHRRHVPGELLSVNPAVAKWVPRLFCLNERAIYLGSWKHGFFSFTAVGATNVGSIKVYFDKLLHTNRPKAVYQCKDKYLGSNLLLKKGDPIGEFRMGSTIVLIFEAPSHFKFELAAGQKLKMGKGIGCVAKSKHVHQIEKNNTHDSGKA